MRNSIQICSTFQKLINGMKYTFQKTIFLMLISTITSTYAKSEVLPWLGQDLRESQAWKAKINIQCVEQGKLCGSIDFTSLNCGGALTFLRKKSGVYIFSDHIRYGNCIQNCQIHVKNDGSSYKEYCKNRYTGGGKLRFTKKIRYQNKVVSNTKPSTNIHSHNGREHSHALPSQGLNHRHNGGKIGVSQEPQVNIYALQKKLKEAGFYSGSINGKVTSETRTALRNYMKSEDNRKTTTTLHNKVEKEHIKIPKIDCNSIDIEKEKVACYAVIVGPKACTSAIIENNNELTHSVGGRIALSAACTKTVYSSFAKEYVSDDLLWNTADELSETACEKRKSGGFLKWAVGGYGCVFSGLSWGLKISTAHSCVQQIKEQCEK